LRDVEVMTGAPVFEPLRKRADFRMLLMDVAMPAAPFVPFRGVIGH
jgi:hypothetical protein